MRPLFLLVALTGLFLTENRDVQQGNRLFAEGKYEQALDAYSRAQQTLPDEPGIRFNRGAALFALGRYPEAQKELQRATDSRDPKLKGSAFYNLGNAHFKQSRFKEAVDAYKRALGSDPRDVRAKWNLELALARLKEEERKKQQEKKQDEKKEQQEQQKEEQAAQSPPPERTEQQKEERAEASAPKPEELPKPKEGQEGEQGQTEPPQPQKASDKPVDKQDAETVLDALERSEKNLELEQARKRARGRRKPAKDY